jgi:hypothetical protein
MQYNLLIDWGNGEKSFQEFDNLILAQKAMENSKDNPEIEFIILVKSEMLGFWSNPCSGEED